MKTDGISKDKNFFQRLRALAGAALSGALHLPTISWMLLGFFLVFFFYFIGPVFLNSYHELRLFTNFPELKPLGADLHEYLNFSRLLADTGTPYTPPNYYPPFEAVFFLRLAQMGPDQAYIYLTLFSFLSFLAITFLYPILAAKDHRLTSPAVFGVISGLFSYGLWFELERGQFDLLVMALCFAGIYLYHSHPRLRLAAYILFILSVNIKIYPLIFILCFTSDWRCWKDNLRRWGLLLLANFAGLFILGWKVFLDFFHALTDQLNQPSYWWSGNHSIDSFGRVLAESFKTGDPATFALLNQNMRWLNLALLLVYGLCLAAVLLMAYRQRLSAANPYLILILTLGALIVPSTSHDYKLSIFIAPLVLLWNRLELRISGQIGLDLWAILLVFFISAAYSTTLFLHTGLPVLLTNNLPALLSIAAACALLLKVRSAQSARIGPGTEFSDLM